MNKKFPTISQALGTSTTVGIILIGTELLKLENRHD